MINEDQIRRIITVSECFVGDSVLAMAEAHGFDSEDVCSGKWQPTVTEMEEAMREAIFTSNILEEFFDVSDLRAIQIEVNKIIKHWKKEYQ